MTMDPATQDAITKRNSETSPLLKLPGEIRNTIYDYALSGADYHITTRLDHGQTDPAKYWQPQVLGKRIYRPALTKTCRQIHHGTLNKHATNSNFHFTEHDLGTLTPDHYDKSRAFPQSKTIVSKSPNFNLLGSIRPLRWNPPAGAASVYIICRTGLFKYPHILGGLIAGAVSVVGACPTLKTLDIVVLYFRDSPAEPPRPASGALDRDLAQGLPAPHPPIFEFFCQHCTAQRGASTILVV